MFRNTFALVLAATLAACTPDDGVLDPIVDEAAATEIAESALQAYNDDHYEGWIAHWNDDMLAMASPEGWDGFRAGLMDTSGAWVSIDDVALEPANKRGYVRWVFETSFEKEPVTLIHTFPEDDDRIAGVFLESENLGE